jgi:hypothetical protein
MILHKNKVKRGLRTLVAGAMSYANPLVRLQLDMSPLWLPVVGGAKFLVAGQRLVVNTLTAPKKKWSLVICGSLSPNCQEEYWYKWPLINWS